MEISGCGRSRDARALDELLSERRVKDESIAAKQRKALNTILARARAKQAANAAKGSPEPCVLDVLVVSGGGDWGAFGAGFLKGWGRVPPGPMARPQFDVVTGVSTGALIAPFAFLGDDASYERIVQLYRNPEKDWVKTRGPFFFLPHHESFARVPGLERVVRERLDRKMIEGIVAGGKEGRILIVNTTDIDDAGMYPWNLVEEAELALQSGDVERVFRILLASTGIPGAFPGREINEALYVDGSVTSNIIYGGGIREEDSLPALWSKSFPDLPQPKIRYWLIFNNKLRPLPAITQPRWPDIVVRSLEVATRSATITAIRHLSAQVEISRLKRGAAVEVRIAAIPMDWVPPEPGVFAKETMNDLADLGEKMGADPSSWITDQP